MNFAHHKFYIFVRLKACSFSLFCFFCRIARAKTRITYQSVVNSNDLKTFGIGNVLKRLVLDLQQLANHVSAPVICDNVILQSHNFTYFIHITHKGFNCMHKWDNLPLSRVCSSISSRHTSKLH